MRRTTKLLLKALAVVVLILVAVLLERQLHFSSIFESSRIEAQLHAAGPLGPALFIIVMGVTVVSPVPTLPLDILAGRVFGPFPGTLYALIGATLGAVVSFFVARWLGRDSIARLLRGHISFCQRCSDKLLIPAVSFDMVSYGSGLTSMSWTKFAAATFVGMLPLTSIYVSFGPMLSISRPVVWVGGAVVVALFFLLPRWIERYDLFGMSRFFEHRSDWIEN